MQAKMLIKDALSKRRMTTKDLVNLLCENGMYTSYSNLHNKINRDTLKYTEVLNILHLLGFELKAEDKIEQSEEKYEKSLSKERKEYIETIIREQEHYIKSIVHDHVKTLLNEMKNEIANELCLYIDNKK